MTLNLIFRINSLIIPPLGFLLNFTLLWLILHRTPKEMWLHSRVLLQTCILDILLLVVLCIGIQYSTTLIGGDAFCFFEGYLILFGSFRQFFNDPMHLWFLVLLWNFFFQLDVFAISVQFLYRYLVLNRSLKITPCRYLLYLTIPLICSFFITFGGYYTIKKPSENNFSEISIDFNENITFAAFEFNESIRNLVVLTIILFYFICYSIIIFCGRQMVKYVAAHTMNERLRELNKQLTKSLIIIAYFPLISQTFLGLFFISSMLVGVINVNEGFFVYLLISWLPIFNPLASLWTFRPYRDAFLRPFKKLQLFFQ